MSKKKINTRSKMHDSNKKIKKFLIERGFTDLYLFPHSRHLKDYHCGDCEFDAIAWKRVPRSFPSKVIYLFQFKTNKSCPKKQLEKYKKLNKEYLCVPCWITVFDKRKLSKKHPSQIEVWSAGEEI